MSTPWCTNNSYLSSDREGTVNRMAKYKLNSYALYSNQILGIVCTRLTTLPTKVQVSSSEVIRITTEETACPLKVVMRITTEEKACPLLCDHHNNTYQYIISLQR